MSGDLTMYQGGAVQVAPQKEVRAAVAAEQSRAIAEVQASLTIAAARPRDEEDSILRIRKACQRLSLAEQAVYRYKRGAASVTGPSIRLAEVLARAWGNLQYGFRELSRDGDGSEVESFCWDLETNTKVVRQFRVRHIRDKRDDNGGNVALTSERDVYELIANNAQRRVRAAILEIIPGDVVEIAVNACKETVRKGDTSRPIGDQVREALAAFADLGVTKAMIEGHLGHGVDTIIAPELGELRQMFTSLKHGEISREDLFAENDRKGKSAQADIDSRKKATPAKAAAAPPVDLVEKAERVLEKLETEPVPVSEKADDLDAWEFILENAEVVIPYLVHLKVLKPGQTLKDITDHHKSRILKTPEAFVQTAGKFAEMNGEKPF